jgi:hypothetical protein
MQSAKKTGDSHMASDAQVVVPRHFLEETGHCRIGRRVTGIVWLAKTDGQSEDVIADLGQQLASNQAHDDRQTSVSMRDFPVPELWTTEIALA